MAAAVVLTPASPALLPSLRGRRHGPVHLSTRRPRHAALRCRATAQTFQGGPAASYAREMERLSAKESLLLAFKDAGGFQALVSGKTTEMQRIDVNERIIGLERLNPTPRPTTSPFLEGRWNFEWFGDSSPGAFAARLLSERSPTSVAHFMGLDVLIKDGYSKTSSDLKFLNTIQCKFLLTTQLSVEGPIRMKEEYVEGLIEIPKISEETLPEQLKGLIGQTAGALQQLPSPIRDAVAEGLKLPLGGMFQRLFMISYLDEEILELKRKSSSPWKNTSLPPSSTPSARRNPPDDVSDSSFTSALITAAAPGRGPSSPAVSHEPGGEDDDASSGDAAESAPIVEGFPVSRWTSSRKCRASALMTSGARTCTILIFRGGAFAMAWESLCAAIADEEDDDEPPRDGSFVACFMATGVSGVRAARLSRETERRGRRWRLTSGEDAGAGGALYRRYGDFEPLDLGCGDL